jgi:hypothetical protein
MVSKKNETMERQVFFVWRDGIQLYIIFLLVKFQIVYFL